MKRKKSPYIILLALIGLFGLSVVKLFGTTVSEKFSSANSEVYSEVMFGGPSYPSRPSLAYRPPTPSHQPFVRSEPVAPRATETLQQAVSTFSVDVDTGSYTQARRAIESGFLPSPQTVRVEEFVNYFHYDYAPVPAPHTASAQFEGAPNPFASGAGTQLVRIGVQARDLRQSTPVHLTFLVDVSGSMSNPDKLPLAKRAIRVAASQLGAADSIAIVTYAGRSAVALPATRATDSLTIGRALDRLRAGGGTAMGSGMRLAYSIAAAKAGPGRVSRVIVMSDGDANIGATSSGSILDEVRSYVDDGVTLSTVGFGTGNYNDALMEQLADAGDGNYTYVDGTDEVGRVFSDGLNSMLHVVAKDMKIQVEFDADTVASWRQVGYENRQIANRDFRNDHVDAGEVGAGHQVTALYEITLRDDAPAAAPLATVRFRFETPDGSEVKEATSTMLVGTLHRRFGDASDDFRFQAAVARFALALQGKTERDWDWIEEIARSAQDGQAERQRFVEMVRRASNQRM